MHTPATPLRAPGSAHLEGEVLREIMRAPDGFAVLLLRADDGAVHRARGLLPPVEAGERLRLVGRWTDHPRHGRQLAAEHAEAIEPADRRGITAYLRHIPGIGPRRAALLIARLGPDVLGAIDEDPVRAFAGVSGLGGAGVAKAVSAWESRRTGRALYVLLAQHGLGRLIGRLQQRWGPDALRRIREDPYALVEIHGAGFLTADRIARSLGVSEDSPRRREAAILHALQEAAREGHVFLLAPELRRRLTRLLATEDEPRLAEHINALVRREVVVVTDQGAVYHRAMWADETAVAARLRDLAAPAPALADLGPGPQGGLTAEQWTGVQRALGPGSRVSVCTGGPGSGKTTLVRAVLAECARAGLRLALCAPTARAARRLAEATAMQAKGRTLTHPSHTVNRLTGWSPGCAPERNRTNPLSADVVVCDESSMLTLEAMRVLTEAIGPGTRLVLVGDRDQLPPVGAGRPFADLIEAGTVPVTVLTRVFRQAARSMIVRAAHEVRAGRVPHPAALRTGHEAVERDLFLLPTGESAEETVERVVDLVARRLPAHYGLDPLSGEVQVFSPMNVRELGCERINAAMRARLMPDAEPILGGRLVVGERVVQTEVNDYASGLMNGDLGVVRGAMPEEGKLLLALEDGRILALPYDEAHNLRPAWALSVHKAQGGEVPAAVLVLDSRAHARMLLSRGLLYTGLTRARRVCCLVADRRAIEMAVANTEAAWRQSGLTPRLVTGRDPVLVGAAT